jgi:hypothetical protein
MHSLGYQEYFKKKDKPVFFEYGLVSCIETFNEKIVLFNEKIKYLFPWPHHSVTGKGHAATADLP